jgi:hypothetical protein
MTPFAALARLGGLSLREAADVLRVREQQAKDMASGRRPTPPGVIAELLDLIRSQEVAAVRALAQAGAITLHVPADDEEARRLGWPCVGAWGAMAARVVAASAQPVAFSGAVWLTTSAADI